MELEQDKLERAVLVGKALSHSVRVEILVALGGAGVLSPVQVSKLGIAELSVANYHARVLEEVGALRLKSERGVRGAVEHFYELTTLGNGVLRLLADV